MFDQQIGALTNASVEAVGWLYSQKNVPKETREKYRNVLGNTYKLIDETLGMVITHLGGILETCDQKEFIKKVKGLVYVPFWLAREQELDLCSELHEVHSEMGSFVEKTIDKLSIKDLEKLNQFIKEIFAREGELAKYISDEFSALSKLANDLENDSTKDDSTKDNELREAVVNFFNDLRAERKKVTNSRKYLFEVIVPKFL